MSSIEQAREEVDRCVQAAIAAVRGEGRQTAAEAERALWAALLALGRADGAVLAAQARSAPGLGECSGPLRRGQRSSCEAPTG